MNRGIQLNLAGVILKYRCTGIVHTTVFVRMRGVGEGARGPISRNKKVFQPNANHALADIVIRFNHVCGRLYGKVTIEQI